MATAETTEQGYSPEAERLLSEFKQQHGWVLRDRLLDETERISHLLSPEELTELVERRFQEGEFAENPVSRKSPRMDSPEADRFKAQIFAAYATEYFTHFGTYSLVSDELKDQRRAEAFVMQGKALRYALNVI